MHRLTFLLVLFCFMTVAATAAFGSAGSGHELPWMNFVWRIVTVALFVGIIAYFFGKKITGFFKGRTDAIATEITALEERKAEAQQRLAQVEKRIANLDAEREAILAEYKAQGEAAKASIIAQAEKAAIQLAAQAKVTAQNEVKHAMDTMRAEMADKIVEATEKLLIQKLTAEEQAKLVDKYLTKVVLN